ncbi:MAG: ATP synthase F1 subunit epsilon [Campylobacterales bacterium]|nr:ATP synthase F1 subunit epsilon [Campylobacterales bacterium]
MNSFKLQIITPQGKVFDSDATSAVFPGDKGEFGVLPGHSCLLSLLGPGLIEVTKENGSKEGVAINWGYAEIDEHKVIVLVDNAIAVEGKTTGDMQKAIEKAEKLLKDATESDTILSVASQKLKNLSK